MKTERRHDLQHNVLDSELSKIVDFFRKHGNQLFWGLMIGAVVVLLVVFARTKNTNRELEALNRYDHLRASSEMDLGERIAAWGDLADSSRVRRIAGGALVAGGDDNLRMFARIGGTEDKYLDEAEWLYRRAVAEFADHPKIVAKAHIGLSGVAKNRGDLASADAELQAVLDMKDIEGSSPFLVAQRLKEQLPSLEEPVTMVYETPSLTEILEGAGDPYDQFVDPFADPFADPDPAGPRPDSDFVFPGESP